MTTVWYIGKKLIWECCEDFKLNLIKYPRKLFWINKILIILFKLKFIILFCKFLSFFNEKKQIEIYKKFK